MSTSVDARGKPCPQPVILTRKALAESAEVTVIVDNPTARVKEVGLQRIKGSEVSAEDRSDGIYVHVTRSGPSAGPTAGPTVGQAVPPSGPVVALIAADTVGRGSEELGGILMHSFLHTLTEVSPRPEVLVFMNTGVRLVVEGSPVLEDLRLLAGRGVEVLACGTCLEYFQLKDRVAVGTVSNMYTIAETLLGAGRVVAV